MAGEYSVDGLVFRGQRDRSCPVKCAYGDDELY